ncbi:MAG: hypothetical protein IJ551_09875 [Prevotella sp.]|nr:hypothetical protein [Prevotella sp.]
MTTTERYNELKAAARYPNTIVLMRCGDFYETYDADAKVCNEVLGLMLTQRNGKAQLLTGFPAYKKEDYTAKLVRAGWRVAICDDTINNKPSNNNNSNHQTTENMKQNFATMRVSRVYWFNREREALVQLVLVRSNFKLDTGKVTHEWAEADGDQKTIKLMTDYDPQQPEQLPRFYESPEKFEKGETMKADALYDMSDVHVVCQHLLQERGCRRIHDDEKGAYVWAFINGQAVKWYFTKQLDVVTWHYKKGVMAWASADEDVPETYYSAEEVYQYNDWTEVRPDGERVTHEAVYNRLRLEPDQEELADKLQAVIDECKAAGMDIYFNYASYDLNAVNVRHVERLAYDPTVDEDTEQAYPFDDSRVARVFNNVGDLNTEDSDVKFVIKKQ